MADNFSLMLQDFKSMADLQGYADAQYRQIIELNKKLKVLDDENKHLKKLLDQSVKDVIKKEDESSTSIIQLSDEESICVMQLKILKETSLDRELSLEETKKLDTFSKVLNNIRNNPKTIKVEAKKLDNDQLMALLNDSSS